MDIEVSKAGEDLIIDFLDESGDDPVRLPPSSLSIATIRSMACDVSDISGQAKVSEAQPDITKKVLRFLE
ncbi:MAG: hypothetical protein KTR17_00110 [Cellvibrionaceae bacterium]|nr:hypothetical protein [Cellvibrionaceae bacterium]